jgi:hypothetical protein
MGKGSVMWGCWGEDDGMWYVGMWYVACGSHRWGIDRVMFVVLCWHCLQVRTDVTYPAGFMDVIELEKTNEHFRWEGWG